MTSGALRAGLLAALVTAATGVPVGLLWEWLAPRERVRVAGDGAVAFVGAGGDLFVGADLLFVLLTAIAGLLCGATAHRATVRSGWPVALGVTLGGVLAALLAARIGEALGSGPLVYSGGRLAPADGAPLPAGTSGVLPVSLQLRATAAVVVLPLVAVLTDLALHLLGPPAPGDVPTPSGLSSGTPEPA